MPLPCSASAPPDLAGFPVSGAIVQTPGLKPVTDAALPGGASAESFDSVLSGINNPETANQSGDGSTPAPDAPAASAEQLAMLAAFTVSQTLSPSVPFVQPVVNEGGENEVALTLIGAEGRTVPEMLARGAETLEYAMAPKKSVSPAPVAAPFGFNAPGDPAPAAPTDVPATQSAAVEASSTPGTDSRAAAPNTASRDSTRATPGTTPAAETQKPTGSPAATTAASLTPPSTTASIDTAAAQTGPVAANVNEVVNAGTTAVVASGISAPSAPKATGNGKLASPLEKSAGLPAGEGRSGGKTPGIAGKNVALNTGYQQDATQGEKVGTGAANWGKTMYQEMSNFADTPLRADATLGVTGSGIASATTRESAQVPVALSRAGDIVNEIRDIADGLWAVERNSVEVKFNFGQQEKLSVRVEYRDGTVSTTFRTDSSNLRDAIAREWQSQAAAVDQRPYRMADPIFGAPNQFGSSTDSDASRQQRSFEQPAQAGRFFLGSAPRSGSSMTSSTVVAPTSRPETPGRLHAIA